MNEDRIVTAELNTDHIIVAAELKPATTEDMEMINEALEFHKHTYPKICKLKMNQFVRGLIQQIFISAAVGVFVYCIYIITY